MRVTWRYRAVACVVLIAITPSVLSGQQTTTVRALGKITAVSEPLGSVAAIRSLPDGSMLVNDPARRQVVLLDADMKVVRVVADTTVNTSRAYGLGVGGLLAYRGDSSVFVDPATLSMLVIDRAGHIARVAAAPRQEDVPMLVGGPLGVPGLDARGRLVYRSNFRPSTGGANVSARPAPVPLGAVAMPLGVTPDSAAVVRFAFESRTLDTAAFIKVQVPRIDVVKSDSGVRVSLLVDPLPQVDDWAVTSRGTLVILRHDYHLEFVTDSGRRVGQRIAFAWQRLTDSAKSAVC